MEQTITPENAHQPQLTRWLDPLMLERAAVILKAVAHPARLGVVQLLDQHGELAVCDISEKLGIEPSLLSHHLSNLKLLRLLRTRREGKNIFYAIEEDHLLGLMECIGNCACKF